MPAELAASLDVELAFVGVQRGVARDVADQNLADTLRSRMMHMESADLAAAPDKGDDGALLRAAALAALGIAAIATARLNRRLALSEVGFAGFHYFTFAADQAGSTAE